MESKLWNSLNPAQHYSLKHQIIKNNELLLNFKLKLRLELIKLTINSGSGGTGRHTILRGWRSQGVRVQVPLSAHLK